MTRIALIALFPVICLAQAADPINPDDDWHLIASSDVIATGTFNVQGNAKGRPNFVNKSYNWFRLAKPRFLKGSASKFESSSLFTIRGKVPALLFQDYVSTDPTPYYRIPPSRFERLDRSEVIVFLIRVQESGEWGNLCVSGYEKNGLVAFDSDFVERTQREISQQERLLRDFPSSKYAQADQYHERVRQIISNFLDSEKQHDAFRELEALGTNAVPSIIRQMDNRRLLPDRSISLVNNSPGSFEALRHYHVYNVVQALDAILNQLTGQSFGHSGSLRENPSAEERSLNGWRLYLIYEIIESTPLTTQQDFLEYSI